MTVNVQMVEQLNQKAKTLNSDRQRMIGQQEAARTSYEKAVLVYKQKYGVQLDDTNLQTEYNAVSSQLQTDFDKLNTLVLSIESGEYKNTQAAMVIPETSVPAQQQMPFGQTASAPQTLQPQATATQQFGAATTETASSLPPSAGLSPADIAAATQAALGQQPVTQATPEASNPVGQPAQFGQPTGGQQTFGQAPVNTPSQPAETQQNNGEQQDVSEQAFTPTGWGQPDKALNKQFENIMQGNGNGGVKFGQ